MALERTDAAVAGNTVGYKSQVHGIRVQSHQALQRTNMCGEAEQVLQEKQNWFENQIMSAKSELQLQRIQFHSAYETDRHATQEYETMMNTKEPSATRRNEVPAEALKIERYNSASLHGERQRLKEERDGLQIKGLIKTFGLLSWEAQDWLWKTSNLTCGDTEQMTSSKIGDWSYHQSQSHSKSRHITASSDATRLSFDTIDVHPPCSTWLIGGVVGRGNGMLLSSSEHLQYYGRWHNGISKAMQCSLLRFWDTVRSEGRVQADQFEGWSYIASVWCQNAYWNLLGLPPMRVGGWTGDLSVRCLGRYTTL